MIPVAGGELAPALSQSTHRESPTRAELQHPPVASFHQPFSTSLLHLWIHIFLRLCLLLWCSLPENGAAVATKFTRPPPNSPQKHLCHFRKWHRCFCGEFGGGRVNFVATAAPFSGRLHQRSRHSLKNMWIQRWSKEVEKGWWKDATGGCWSSARVGDSLWVDCERAGANSPPATGIISWILACSQHSKKNWNYVY